MKSSQWRQYRGHLIVKRRTWLLGLRRFEVWDGRLLVGSYPDVIRAEVCVDHRLCGKNEGNSG